MLTKQFGPLLTAAEFIRLRGWTDRQLQRAITSGRVFCIVHADVQYLPAFLAEPRLLEAGLERVCKLLASLPAGSKLQFFTTGKASLNTLTPLQCLAEGRIRSVMTAARGFLER